MTDEKKIKSDWTIPILLIGFVIGALVVTFSSGGGKYRAFKCNYRAAVFGPDASENLKEFGGDPCMKKGMKFAW